MQKLVTEHVTSVNGVNRHWIQFTMESNDTAIMDLNDTDNRIVVPKIDNFQWVPKESKSNLRVITLTRVNKNIFHGSEMSKFTHLFL